VQPGNPAQDEAGAGRQAPSLATGELLALALQLHERGEAYAMVTVVRTVAPSSAFAGAQAIVCGDGSLHGWIGGGCAQRVVVEAALEAMRLGVPKLVHIGNDPQALPAERESHGMPCASNGAIELFIHPAASAPLLLILGSTPVAACARAFAQDVGLRVSDQAQGSTPQLALVATQGDGDGPALEAALASTARHVLMVASARKAQRMREALRRRGVREDRLATLEAPAGPDIGARTPAEIALAAIAGAIAWWRADHANAQASAHAAPGGTPAAPAPERAAWPVDPVCGMSVDPAQARHSLDYESQRWLFCCAGCKAQFERDPARYARASAGSQHAA